MRAVWLIARSVLIEAVRRKEIYVIVLLSTLFIGAVMTIDFFDVEGLTRFYREVALKIMSIAAALTVVVLAARQLPREFETRTIYPMLAKPVSRATFLLGKLAGVMCAAIFTFTLFMSVFLLGNLYLHGSLANFPWVLFLQYVYLQLLMMLVLATLSFWLSMLLNLDAAITIGIVLYSLASTMMSMFTFLFDVVDPLVKRVLIVLLYIIPQLTLFDLSEKATHAEIYDPVSLGIMGQLTAYALVFSGIYFGFAMICFRRRAI